LPQQPDIPPTDIVLVPQERDGVLMAADTVLGVTPGQHRSLRSELKAAGVRPPPKGFVVRPLAVPFHREGDRTWWMMFACPQAVDDPECNKLVIERMSRDLHRVADQVLLHGILPPPLTHSSLTRDIWAAITRMPGRDFFATRAGHKYKYRVLWNDPTSGRSTGPRLAVCYGGHVFIKNDRRLEVVLGKPALALRKKGQS
jgi:hypothetical protein